MGYSERDSSVSQKDRSVPPVSLFKQTKNRVTKDATTNIVVINQSSQKSRNDLVLGKTLSKQVEEPSFEYDWDNEESTMQDTKPIRLVTCYD